VFGNADANFASVVIPPPAPAAQELLDPALADY
jgi:hypothetical protein